MFFSYEMRIVWGLRASSHLACFAAIEQQRDQDHDAGGDAATGLGDVVFLEDGAEDDQEDCTGDCAPVVSPTAEDGGAADDDRRDAVEEVGIAHAKRRLLPKGGQSDACYGGKQAAQSVDDDRDQAHVDTGKVGCHSIVAKCVNTATERGEA